MEIIDGYVISPNGTYGESTRLCFSRERVCIEC